MIGKDMNRRYRIIYKHGIGAPSDDMARSLIETIVKRDLGGDTKFAQKAWERIWFMFDVEEVDEAG